MGNTKAVTGYLSFGIKHPTRFSSARVDTDLILKAIGHNAIIIRDLVEQQKLEWGILIFEGDDILDGLAGLESALIERAAALCIPVRQKVEY